MRLNWNETAFDLMTDYNGQDGGAHKKGECNHISISY